MDKFKLNNQMNGSNAERLRSKQSKTKSISQLDLYGMSKQALIKKIQVLVHELKIYYQLEEAKQDPRFENAKQYSEVLVSIEAYKHNQDVLTQQVKSLQKKQRQLQSLLCQKQNQVAKLHKELLIYKKKQQDFQKMGGKNKIQRLEEANKQQKQQIQSMVSENKDLKKQIILMTNKCKILQELNNETEAKIAEILINRNTISRQQQIELKKEKENDMNYYNKIPTKQNNIEILSLKEKVRQLREQLKASEDNREQIKAKMQERQIFYSKMIASKI